MNTSAIGIDLGTSTSVISTYVRNRAESLPDPRTKTPIVPSVVARNRRGELVVGQSAIDDGVPGEIVREAKREMGTSYAFPLGDVTLRAEEVGAMVLRKMKENAETALGVPVTHAVITVPAYFGDLQRRATEAAARLAGLEPLRLISEPTAAALAFGMGRPEVSGTLMVFDFGGGTLDVTIFEMFEGVLEVKVTDGDDRLGGKDIDDILMARIVAKAGVAVPIPGTRQFEDLKKKAESVKKALTTSEAEEAYIQNYDGGRDLDVTISRAEFDDAIAPLLQRACDVIDRALAKGGIVRSEVERLILVGGTCYTPAVRNRVQDHVGRKAEAGVDPDLAVSQGACVSAGLKAGIVGGENAIVVQDAATFRMGVGVLSDIGGQELLIFDELMPANAPIPFYRKSDYRLRHVAQSSMELSVYQADPHVVLAQDAIRTGASGVIEDIPESRSGAPHEVEVEFKCDENHIIRVTAKIPAIAKSLTLVLNNDDSALPGAGVDASKIDALWQSSPIAVRHQSLIKRAEAALEGRPPQTERIEALLIGLKERVAANDSAGAQAARELLVDVLADL